MKPHTANSPSTAAENSERPQSSPTYITVYTFVIWDHDRQTTTIYPRMATLAAIAKMRGKVNEDTAWVVDASDLDVEGFYSGGSPPSP
ncbi:MAG TPA: hypothetical protein VNO35_27455 [Steroidobacteraceae bacterium]|nr:hypothetical protein [Steroidobacteraceae bacterium]